MTTEQFDPDERIIDGIVNFAEAIGDKSYGQVGGAMYKTVAEVFRSNLRADDPCKLAFPSMVITPDARVECFVAITSSTLMVAWKRGLFRKTIESEIVPLASIKNASWEVSTKPSTRGAVLMHVEGDRSVTFALPADRPDIAGSIQQLLQPSSGDGA